MSHSNSIVASEGVIAIAIICHEANRAFCATQGDYSHKEWGQSHLDLQRSVIDGVQKVARGEITEPGQSHANWLAFKRAEGWTFGPVKDFEAKTHPCLLPFHELPYPDQTKDHLFVAIATTLLAR